MRLYRPYSSCSGPSSGSITGSSGAKWSGSIKAEPQLGHLIWSSSGSTTFMPAWCSENTLRHTEQTNFVSVIGSHPSLGTLACTGPATSVNFYTLLGLGLHDAVPNSCTRYPHSSCRDGQAFFHTRSLQPLVRRFDEDSDFLSCSAFHGHPLHRHAREHRTWSRR